MAQKPTTWTCPDCNQTFAVSGGAIPGWQLCPNCTGPKPNTLRPKKKSQASLIIAVVAGFVFLASVGVAVSVLSTGGGMPQIVQQAAQGVGIQVDPDKAIVNKRLKENLPSGKWEEIQWWPAVEFRGTQKKRRICGIKIRTSNNGGAASVQQQVLEIEQQKAKLIPTDSDNACLDDDCVGNFAWKLLENPTMTFDVNNYNGVNIVREMEADAKQREKNR